jgi:hypothetical protein
MKIEKIKVDRMSLASLMNDMFQGRIRVPRFQRVFVWERKRIQELLDSMYKEYPIGTIFLWNSPPKYNHLIRTVDYLGVPQPKDGANYSLIVDGQQRLTSLFAVVYGRTIEGEDYRKIVFDLTPRDLSKRFLYREPDNRRWISVKTVIDRDFQIYNNLPSDEHREQYQHCANLLANYPFSVVTVDEMDIDDAIEIFERINRSGKPLNRFDLITASILSDDFDLREKTQSDIVEPLEQIGFGTIEETSVVQSLALVIKGRTESSTQMELTNNEVKEVWERVADCFLHAVHFVRENLAVTRVDMLPYDGILPILAYYFFYAKTNEVLGEHREQLERWFWCVAFSERYSAASQTRMTEDALWIRELIDEGKKCEIPVNLIAEAFWQSSMKYTTSAIRNGVVCLLNSLRPLHFLNGTHTYVRGDHFESFVVADNHHVFPVGFLKREGYKTVEVHKLPNFAFIAPDVDRWIANRAPSEYMEEIRERYGQEHFDRVMYSHLIPTDEHSGIWSNNYERFGRQRAELFLAEVRKRCGISDRLADEYRDPLVNAIEVGLRDSIHIQLGNQYGFDYWGKHVSRHVNEQQLEQRIDEHFRRIGRISGPERSDPRQKLNFLLVLDYLKIVENNWNCFSAIFDNLSDFRRAVDDFNTFRNAVKHNRSIDATIEHRAKAAIIWFSRQMDLDLTAFGL